MGDPLVGYHKYCLCEAAIVGQIPSSHIPMYPYSSSMRAMPASMFSGSAGCLEEDSRYSPLGDVNGEGRTDESDATACQARCLGVAGCSFFSFWADGGCHLSSSAATKTTASGVTAGPKTCAGALVTTD